MRGVWKGNTSMWWNVRMFETYKWACFKECSEKSPKFNIWGTLFQDNNSYKYIELEIFTPILNASLDFKLFAKGGEQMMTKAKIL
jgi:hypothetical protein